MRTQADLLRGDHRAVPLPAEALHALSARGPALTALIADLTAVDPARRLATAAQALARIDRLDQ
jgi:hypothetical protein